MVGKDWGVGREGDSLWNTDYVHWGLFQYMYSMYSRDKAGSFANPGGPRSLSLDLASTGWTSLSSDLLVANGDPMISQPYCTLLDPGLWEPHWNDNETQMYAAWAAISHYCNILQKPGLHRCSRCQNVSGHHAQTKPGIYSTVPAGGTLFACTWLSAGGHSFSHYLRHTVEALISSLD